MSKFTEQRYPRHAGAWRRRDSGDCLWVDCDNASVVFHRQSGQTHFLNSAGKVLLDMLLDNTLTTVDIAKSLRHDETELVEQEYLSQIESMLRRLEQLGFLERV